MCVVCVGENSHGMCVVWVLGEGGSEALSGVEMVEYMRVKLERGLGMTRNKHGCAVGKNMA